MRISLGIALIVAVVAEMIAGQQRHRLFHPRHAAHLPRARDVRRHLHPRHLGFAIHLVSQARGPAGCIGAAPEPRRDDTPDTPRVAPRAALNQETPMSEPDPFRFFPLPGDRRPAADALAERRARGGLGHSQYRAFPHRARQSGARHPANFSPPRLRQPGRRWRPDGGAGETPRARHGRAQRRGRDVSTRASWRNASGSSGS